MTQLDLIPDVDLLDALKWVNDAVDDKKKGLEVLSSYFLKSDYIHAYNGRMVVGTPFPFPHCPHLVPAKEFQRVLANKPDGNFEWLTSEDRLTLKRGRFKSGMKIRPVDEWVWPTDLPVGLRDVPTGLVDTLERLMPFVSENATKPWATCFCLIGDKIYASNNVVIAESDCVTNVPGDQYLIPIWAAEFICARREGLDKWFPDETNITFTWTDGSWMRSALVADTFPPADRLLEIHYKEDPDVQIESAWKKSLLRVCKISEDAVIRLRADGILSQSGEVLTVEDDASTPCPEGLSESVWDIRFLKDVLETATHWNPRHYPKPATWMGDNIRGVILGRIAP